MRNASWRRLESIVGARPIETDHSWHDTDPVVRRYFDHALTDAVPRSPMARLQMHGHIKIGRWRPFRARQLLAPLYGTVWSARVAGVILGSDRFVDGAGGMDWRVLGLVPVMRAEGEDVSRSAAERAAGESIWLPTAVEPSDRVTWTVDDDTHVSVEFAVGDHRVTLHHAIDLQGRLRSSWYERWGDPDNSGTWRMMPFGVEVTAERRFNGITIPAEGIAGWHFGTDRWADGQFFQFTITDHEPIGSVTAASTR